MPPVFFSPRAVVLDCGPRRTALAIFGRHRRRIFLKDYAVESLPPAAAHGDQWREATGAALRSLRARVTTRNPVTLLIPSQLVFTRVLTVPRVGPAKLIQILAYEAEQSIPYALADVVWQSAVVHKTDRDLEVLLAAAKLETVEPLCSLAHESGFEPRIVLPAFLGARAMIRAPHAAAGDSDLLLVVGPKTATVLQTAGGRFAMRTFMLDATPGAHIGDRMRPVGPEDEVASPVGEPWLDRLAQEITRSILHFGRRDEWIRPLRLTVAGEHAPSSAFTATLAAKLNLPVAPLDWTGGLVAPDGVAHDELSKLFELAGAAATQLLPDQLELNLLPPRWRLRESTRRRQRWLAAALVLLVAAPVPPLIQYHRVAIETRKKDAALERELAPWQARERRNHAALRQIAALGQQLASREELTEQRGAWSGFLADLQDRLMAIEDVWLERLQIASPAAGAPFKIAIAGRMLDKADPQATASAVTYGRLKALLASIGESPFVAAIEAERLDNKQPGILRFEFVIVGNPQRPL